MGDRNGRVRGRWFATKSYKASLLPASLRLPKPHSCSIYLSILGSPKPNSLRCNHAQGISQPPRGCQESWVFILALPVGS